MPTLATGPQAIKEISLLSRCRHLLKYTPRHLRPVVLCQALLGVQRIVHIQLLVSNRLRGLVIVLAP